LNSSLKEKKIPRIVNIWLIAGLVLLFVQVNIGGITRLTDSGLSITEWEIIRGTLPPLSADAWDTAFDKYRTHATKNFESMHGADMTMSEFKVIYFWEWFHRFWARSIGFIFLIPFLFFVFKNYLPAWLIKRLGIVVSFAALAATFGIIMVYSGFNDDTRTWVSAYKLLGHLSIACLTFGFLYWTWLKVKYPDLEKNNTLSTLRPLLKWIMAVLIIQIGLGALMAGMRAGLIHPYFSILINGEQFWNLLWTSNGGLVENIVDYEQSASIKAWIQIMHRGSAYLLAALILWFYIKSRDFHTFAHIRFGSTGMLVMLLIQIVLGIMTIVNSIGKIPLVYGVLHQAGALLLLSFVLFSTFHMNRAVKV